MHVEGEEVAKNELHYRLSAKEGSLRRLCRESHASLSL
jgi:hypothetical protein